MADGSVVIEILGDPEKFNAALAKVEKSVGKAASGIGSAMASAGKALTAAVTVPLAGAAVAAAKWAFDTASAAEQADIAFSTMLGPQKAKELIADLADFAKKTPFEMSGLTSATQKLLAYGFAAEDVIPLLTSVGDATAGLGAGQDGIDAVTRALGQMQAKGKVMSEEMLQLTEVGIPAWRYLADVVSNGDIPTAMEMVTDGAVSADTAIRALQDGMNRDFGGMMSKQAETLQGALSNLMDGIEGVFRKIKDTEGWSKAAAAVSDLADSIGPLAEKAVPLVDGALSKLAEIITEVARAADGMDAGDVEDLAMALVKAAAAGPSLLVAGKAIGAVGTVLDKASDATDWLSKTFGKLKKAMALASGGAGTFGEAIGAVGLTGTVATAAIAGVALAVGVAAAAFQDWQKRQENLAEATEGLNDVVEDTAALDGYADTIDDVGRSSREAAMSADELAESTAKRVEAMRQNTEAAEEQIAQLNTAQDIINRYAGQTDLTADAQGRLEWAIGLVNEQLGLSITQSDVAADSYRDQNGNVVDLTDSINALIDAKKNEARVSAVSENLTEAYKAQSDAAKTLAQAQQDYNDKVDYYIDAQADLGREVSRADAEAWAASTKEGQALDSATKQYESATGAVASYEEQLGEAAAASSEAGDAYDRLSSAMGSAKFDLFSAQLDTAGTSFSMLSDDLRTLGADTEAFAGLSEEQLQELAESYDGTASSIAGKLRELGVVSGEFSGIFSQTSAEMQASATTLADAMGIPMGQLEQQLADMGVSTEQLNAIGSAQFASLAANCGGSMEQLAWMIKNYNATPIVDKGGKVTVDQTQLMDAEGRIYEWNGNKLLDQDGKVVVDEVELTDAQGNVVKWNGSKLEVLQGAVEVDDGELEDALSLVSRWNNSSLRTLTGSATVTTTERTVRVVETQQASRSAPSPARAQAAAAAIPAAAAAEAPSQLSAVAARLAASPLPAPLMATAAGAVGAVAARAVEERAARAAADAVVAELSGTPAWAERLERAIEGSADRIEEAVGAPVEIVWEMRELGRLIKEATA